LKTDYIGRRRRKIKLRRRMNVMIAISIMFLFLGIFSYQITALEKTNKEKTKELSVIKQEYQTEKKRTSELEDKRVFVQTKEYVVQEAKKLGFVFPGEIVFKPEEKN